MRIKMPYTIRESTFETNSSSSHSLVIVLGKVPNPDTSIKVHKGKVTIYSGDFDRGPQSIIHDAKTKASYCLTYAKSFNRNYDNVIEDSYKSKQLLYRLQKVIAKEMGLTGCSGQTDDYDAYKKVLFRSNAPSRKTTWPSAYWGYIDHQSRELCMSVFATDEALRDFIFNTNSTLFIQSDEDSKPIDPDYEKQGQFRILNSKGKKIL